MPQSYFGAGAGQSGSVQSIGGAVAGLFGEDDELEPRYYSDILNKRSNQYARLFKPEEVKDAYGEYNTLYRGNDPLARENANFYTEQAKGILGDNTKTADTYERLRSGNLSSLGDVFKNVLDYGLASQKARLAAGGFGGSGPSAYDRILSSTMTASNLSPVLNTIYGNLGRDASAAVTGDRAWDAYRMGQFAGDPLTGYVDAATAGRAINPLLTYRGLINNDVGGMSNLLNGVIKPNLAGYDLVPGLASRLNNLASGTMNMANFGSQLISQYGGAMTGGGIQGIMDQQAQQAGGGGGGGGGGGMGGMGGGGMGGMSGMAQQVMPMVQQYWPMIQQMMGGARSGVGSAPATAYASPNFSGVGQYGNMGIQY